MDPDGNTVLTLDKSVMDKIVSMCATKNFTFSDLYILILQHVHDIDPVVFLPNKVIFKNSEDAVHKLTTKAHTHNIAIETIKILMHRQAAVVNDETTKIYICPYTGKVFGNNTCNYPEDEIYDWVSTYATSNNIGTGTKFFISSDKELINTYLSSNPDNYKTVYKIQGNNQLFLDVVTAEKQLVKSLVPMDLNSVLNQNKFQIEASFLKVCQHVLQDSYISKIVAVLNQAPTLKQYSHIWENQD